MADLPPYRTPRWVKIIGIIALVLVLLLGILHLTSMRGNHGPGRHLPSGDAGSTPPVSIIVDQSSFTRGSMGERLSIAHRMNTR
jgi:hypothetical protein